MTKKVSVAIGQAIGLNIDVSDKLEDGLQTILDAPFAVIVMQSPSQIVVSFETTRLIIGSTVTLIESIDVQPKASVRII